MTSDFTMNMNEYLPLRDLVFNVLRMAILKGELQPGERLMEIQLAEKLGVSRTPIREAIRKLELEGLVLMIPRRGAEVAAISEKRLKDVLEVRKNLEDLAVRLACGRAKSDTVKNLEEAQRGFMASIESGDLIAMAEADEKFHFLIYDAADNEKLQQILTNLKENMYQFRLEYLKNEDARKGLIEEHTAIIEAIKKNDAEEAVHVMDKHIDNQEKVVVAKLKESVAAAKKSGKKQANAK